MKIDAINGSEPSIEGEDVRNTLINFYSAFNGRDRARVIDAWCKQRPITMSNPLGGVKQGHEEIEQVYQRIFDGPMQVFVEFYDINIDISDQMFCAAGRERGMITIDNDEMPLAIRTSRIFVKEDGVWRHLHHHGSIDDPDMLARYRNIASAAQNSIKEQA